MKVVRSFEVKILSPAEIWIVAQTVEKLAECPVRWNEIVFPSSFLRNGRWLPWKTVLAHSFTVMVLAHHWVDAEFGVQRSYSRRHLPSPTLHGQLDLCFEVWGTAVHPFEVLLYTSCQQSRGTVCQLDPCFEVWGTVVHHFEFLLYRGCQQSRWTVCQLDPRFEVWGTAVYHFEFPLYRGCQQSRGTVCQLDPRFEVWGTAVYHFEFPLYRGCQQSRGTVC